MENTDVRYIPSMFSVCYKVPYETPSSLLLYMYTETTPPFQRKVIFLILLLYYNILCRWGLSQCKCELSIWSALYCDLCICKYKATAFSLTLVHENEQNNCSYDKHIHKDFWRQENSIWKMFICCQDHFSLLPSKRRNKRKKLAYEITMLCMCGCVPH